MAASAVMTPFQQRRAPCFQDTEPPNGGQGNMIRDLNLFAIIGIADMCC